MGCAASVSTAQQDGNGNNDVATTRRGTLGSSVRYALGPHSPVSTRNGSANGGGIIWSSSSIANNPPSHRSFGSLQLATGTTNNNNADAASGVSGAVPRTGSGSISPQLASLRAAGGGGGGIGPRSESGAASPDHNSMQRVESIGSINSITGSPSRGGTGSAASGAGGGFSASMRGLRGRGGLLGLFSLRSRPAAGPGGGGDGVIGLDGQLLPGGGDDANGIADAVVGVPTSAVVAGAGGEQQQYRTGPRVPTLNPADVRAVPPREDRRMLQWLREAHASKLFLEENHETPPDSAALHAAALRSVLTTKLKTAVGPLPPQPVKR